MNITIFEYYAKLEAIYQCTMKKKRHENEQMVLFFNKKTAYKSNNWSTPRVVTRELRNRKTTAHLSCYVLILLVCSIAPNRNRKEGKRLI